MADSPRHRANIRDLPVLFLLFGVFFAVAAISIPLVDQHDLAYEAKENDLQTISGSVSRPPYMTPGRQLEIHIMVYGSDGFHDLTQKNMDGKFPETMNAMMALRVGDKVTARVKHDPFGGGSDWVWELQRDGITILRYRDTQAFYGFLDARHRQVGHLAIGFAFVFLLVAIFRRKKFGTWTDTRNQHASVF